MLEAPKMQTPAALAMNPGAFPLNRAAGIKPSCPSWTIRMGVGPSGAGRAVAGAVPKAEGKNGRSTQFRPKSPVTGASLPDNAALRHKDWRNSSAPAFACVLFQYQFPDHLAAEDFAHRAAVGEALVLLVEAALE